MKQMPKIIVILLIFSVVVRVQAMPVIEPIKPVSLSTQSATVMEKVSNFAMETATSAAQRAAMLVEKNIDALANIPGDIMKRVADIPNRIAKQLANIPNQVMNSVNRTVSDVTSLPSNMVKQATSAVNSMTNQVVNAPGQAVNQATSAINSTVNQVTNAPGQFVNQTTNMVNSTVNQAVNAPGQVVNQAVNTVNSSANKLLSTPGNALNSASNMLGNTVDNVLGTPSGIFKTLDSGVDYSIREINRMPKDEVNRVVNRLFEGRSSQADYFKNIESRFMSAGKGAQRKLSNAPSKFTSSWDKAVGKVTDIPDNMLKSGDRLVSGVTDIPDDFANKGEKILDKVTDMPDKTISNLEKGVDKITGAPDKLLNKGENIVDNLLDTPDKLMNKAENTIDKLQNMPEKTLSKVTDLPSKILNDTQRSLERAFSPSSLFGGDFTKAFGGFGLDDVESYPTRAFDYVKRNATSKMNSFKSSTISKFKNMAKQQAKDTLLNVVAAKPWNAMGEVVNDAADYFSSDDKKTASTASGTAQASATTASSGAQAVAQESALLAQFKDEVRNSFFLLGENTTNVEEEKMKLIRAKDYADIVAQSAALTSGMRASIVEDAALNSTTPIAGESTLQDIAYNTEIQIKMARQLVALIGVHTQLLKLDAADLIQSLDLRSLEMPKLEPNEEIGA